MQFNTRISRGLALSANLHCISAAAVRTLTAAAIGTTLVLAAATAHAAPSKQLVYGSTKVILAEDFVGALGTLGVTPGAIRPGVLSSRYGRVKAAFRITSGDVDLGSLTLEILHQGGLTLTASGMRVALTSFIIENLGGKLQLTGLVKANDDIVGRIPLFDVALTEDPIVKRGVFWVRNANVTLSSDAAEALNAVFGVSAFVEGFPIGTAFIGSYIRDLDG